MHAFNSKTSHPSSTGCTKACDSSFWAILLILTLGSLSRLQYAVTTDAHPDEMLHLPSFRNHYDSSDIYPVFRARLECPTSMPEKLVQFLRRYYETGPLAQRSLLVAMDGQPLLFPLMMEAVQAVTYDSLIAMRFVAVAGSIGAIITAWLVGSRLGGPSVGLCFAGMIAGSAASSYYGALARSYAWSELGLLTLLMAAACHTDRGNALSSKLMAAALFTQSTHWFAWPIVGVVIAFALTLDLIDRATVGTILRRGWWYVAGSCVLLVYLALQRINPNLQKAGVFKWNVREAFEALTQVAPIGGASWFPQISIFATAALVALAILGASISLSANSYINRRQWLLAVLAPLIGAMTVMLLTPAFSRYYLTATVPISLAVSLLMTSVPALPSAIVAICITASGAFMPFVLPKTCDPYLSEWLPGSSHVAPCVREEILRTGRWVSFPYYFADRLYRELPECPAPYQPQTKQELVAYLGKGLPTTVIAFTNVRDWCLDVRGELREIIRVDQGVVCYRFEPDVGFKEGINDPDTPSP
jgi:hypothetical protein